MTGKRAVSRSPQGHCQRAFASLRTGLRRPLAPWQTVPPAWHPHSGLHLVPGLGWCAPCYGEDNHYVYGELLGMSAQEIAALAEEGVI
jgi:hypothetical protein